MAGLPWFELDVDMPDDPKCSGLAARLHNPLAFGYVVRLYAYCYRHATDRFVGPGASQTIEDSAAHWRGKDGALVAALFSEGFLDREGDTLIVHGVAKRLGPHLEARKKAVERQRRARDKAAKGVGGKASPTGDELRESRVTSGVTSGERDAGVTAKSRCDMDMDSSSDLASKQISDRDRRPATSPAGLPPPGSSASDDPVARFRRDLSAALAIAGANPLRVAKPDLVPHFRAELARIGVEQAVALCAEHARDCGKVPKTLDWFADFLAEQERPAPVRAPNENPKPSDPDFNDPAAWPDYGAFLRRDDGRGEPELVEGPDGKVTIRWPQREAQA